MQAIADRINTGEADPETSRALIVFNRTDGPLSGVAVFPASLSWPAGMPLPPVAVCDHAGTPVPSAVTDLAEGPDRKGRPDRYHLTFGLRLAVADVPPQGWRTYIAAYSSEPVPDHPDALARETPGLVVVETLPHAGDLPPTGRTRAGQARE